MDKNMPLLSEEEILDITKVLQVKYAAYIEERYFQIQAHADDLGIIYVTVTLRNKTGSFYYPVEARIELQPGDEAKERVFFMLDYIDLYLEEYLTINNNTFLPIDWTYYECEGVKFQLKGQIINLELEKEAERIISD